MIFFSTRSCRGGIIAGIIAAQLTHCIPFDLGLSSPNNGELLVVSADVATLESLPVCATYHGTVGKANNRQSIVFVSDECRRRRRGSRSWNTVDIRRIPYMWEHTGRLIWIEGSSLDESVLELQERRTQLAQVKNSLALDQEGDHVSGDRFRQQIFSSISGSVKSREPTLLMELKDGSLFQFHNDSSLMDWTMRPENSFDELVAIPSSPLPLPKNVQLGSMLKASTENLNDRIAFQSSVNQSSIDRINGHIKQLRFSPLVSSLLSTLPMEQFVKDVRFISGEDQTGVKEGEGWISRHSMSEGGTKASFWLISQMRSFGLNCTHHQYLPEFAPMISCEIQGTGPEAGTFVLGGHFDSRGSFGYPSAPGADDDGSGTALILSLARHITTHRLTFKRKVILALFSGEEQGLLGSRHFAKKLKEEDDEDVVLMVQADMIGFRKKGEPLQIAFPDLIGLPEARYLMGNISELYQPQLVVGLTSACCSDHQSFDQVGYASTWVFERNNPIADPCYHNSCDTSMREGYDFDQILASSKVVLATLLEVAGFAFV